MVGKPEATLSVDEGPNSCELVATDEKGLERNVVNTAGVDLLVPIAFELEPCDPLANGLSLC